MAPKKRNTRTALVLSGGGMRGAYEVGALRAFADILAEEGLAHPFDVFVGSSVGAINSTYIAAHADEPRMGIDGLAEVWRSLSLTEHLRFDFFGLNSGDNLLNKAWRSFSRQPRSRIGPALVDSGPLEKLIERAIPFDRLHNNVRSGLVRAVVVTALNVYSGKTNMFVELGPRVSFHPSRDPRRKAVGASLGADHVLASSAIPVIFPSRRVGEHFFADGGIRFNTPVAPAIRAGADRLVIVSPLASFREHGSEKPEQPGLFSMVGKLLNALLADPVVYDLHVLERFNRLIRVLKDSLDDGALEDFHRVTEQSRGIRYREIDTLVFLPKCDMGRIAAEYLREGLPKWNIAELKRRMLKTLAGKESVEEADWASYLLFDGGLAEKLMAVGYDETLARRDDILAFMGRVP